MNLDDPHAWACKVTYDYVHPHPDGLSQMYGEAWLRKNPYGHTAFRYWQVVPLAYQRFQACVMASRRAQPQAQERFLSVGEK